MLSSIQISGFRGIARSAALELAPLTILLGPNGSGKSAVLDALLIGSHPRPTEAVGHAVQRRGLKDSAKWLLRRADPDTEARIEVSTPTMTRTTVLRFREGGPKLRGHAGPFGRILLQLTPSHVPSGPIGTVHVPPTPVTHFAYDDRYVADDFVAEAVLSPDVRLVDSFEPYEPVALARTFDQLLLGGRIGATHALLTKLVRGAKELRISVDAANAPLLYVVFEGEAGAVPLGLAGDGVKLAVRASMALAVSREGVVLLEEPDAHLHPAALWLLAKAMVEAVRGGLQVILSTHSLELVDALIAECADDLSRLAILRTRLRDGELVTVRTPGDEARHDRVDLDEDLR
jgi:hypothetical protein